MHWIGVLISSMIIMSSMMYSVDCIRGWTDPMGPIYIERGTRLSIKCVVESDNELHTNSKLSSRLGFYTQTGEEFNRTYVSILNDTAIELVIPKVPEQESMIICKFDGSKGVLYNDVKVGHKPDEIDHIDCISRNFENLTCTFKKPYNPIHVQYDMKYRPYTSNLVYNCQIEPSDLDIFQCTVPEDAYRRFYKIFGLTLFSSNLFGSRNQSFEFDNLAVVIPAKVEELKVSDTSKSDSITISWHAPQRMAVFPGKFDVEISLNSSIECSAKEQKILIKNFDAPKKISSREFEEQIFKYEIPAKFANQWYDVGVRMKVSAAKFEERMWSEMAKIQAFTASRIPDTPPEINVGSFNILPNGDVYIYWKHLPKCFQNGNDFGYSIKSNIKPEAPSEFNHIYAVYRQDFNNRTEDTIITIRSKNMEGSSREASTLIIPGKNRRLRGPTKINKKSINGTYILSWSPPENNREEIVSYTVFWCPSKTELINQCENSIEFKEHLPHETTFHYESDQTINFAISANSKDSTSGMMWAKCTTANSYEIGKIRTARISRLTSKEIEVEWNLDCTDSGIVAGYQIEFCPTNKPKTLECISGSENRTNITMHNDITKHTLRDLKPYTTYKIIIRMFSNSTMGPPSEPLANTTLEDAPSEVRNLIARNVGNTSVVLSWDPPEEINGVLGSYDIWKNGKMHYRIEVPKTFDNEHLNMSRKSYTLEGLIPFEDYDIAVLACTNKCSVSATTKIRTTIGAPGEFLKQPSFQSRGSTYLFNSSYDSAVISWDEPKFRGGNLDYYELKTTFYGNDDTTLENTILIKSRKCIIDKLCINNVTGKFEFSVRAVNFVLTPHAKQQSFLLKGNTESTISCINDSILLDSMNQAQKVDPYGYYLKGPWSDPYYHSCQISSNYSKQYVFITFLMIASLMFVVMVFYLYRRIKDMKDILVQMPPGLEDLQPEKPNKKGKESNADKKPDLLHNIDRNTYILNEDEHGSLLKGSLNGSINGADCSSSMRSESESSRSDVDHADMIDEVEYNDFGQQNNNMSDGEMETTTLSNHRPQSIIMNSSVPKEIAPILISPESISASTPIAEKFTKPNVMSQIKAPSSTVYVAPPVTHSTPVPPQLVNNGNGYVTHSMLNPQSNGYTQLNAFGKPILNNDRHFMDKMNLKTPIVATTDQEGISGYVTHKQLSDFGHRMQ